MVEVVKIVFARGARSSDEIADQIVAAAAAGT